MIPDPVLYVFAAGGALVLLRAARRRLRLSLAKHPSLQGHVRLARRVARQIPYYAYRGDAVFACDDAPADITASRRADFDRLGEHFRRTAPQTLAAGRALVEDVPDAAFTQIHRVPFQFREHVRHHLPVPAVIAASEGNRIEDLDGNVGYDLSGSYGVNVFGLETYKACLDRGFERARALGPALGGYHPVVAENAERLKRLSGLDAVSFHMSGTEAVMQAVRLARYHTGRRYVVRFAGAYHGWWDGVQVGVGSQRRARDVLTLRERHAATLRVLRTRRDIAAVLVSPLQMMHPNRAAPGDATLVADRTMAAADRAGHAHWLAELRSICSERDIALIFDEIYSGFRLARGGAQEYFGVAADLVTYGKSLGGGLPVGVLCGRERFMTRFRPDRPADICFARGTFNAHPYVMTCMNEFLRHLASSEVERRYADLHAVWDRRTARFNAALAERDLPVRLSNLASVLIVEYTAPSRYNWMFQFHLRARGLVLSWTGTGRLIMSHDYTDADFEAVIERFVAAAEAMRDAGWWWHPTGQTSGRIGRRILREMLAARLRGRLVSAPEPVSAPARDVDA